MDEQPRPGSLGLRRIVDSGIGYTPAVLRAGVDLDLRREVSLLVGLAQQGLHYRIVLVVALGDVPEGHLAVWYGAVEGSTLLVRTVPAEYCVLVDTVCIYH